MGRIRFLFVATLALACASRSAAKYEPVVLPVAGLPADISSVYLGTENIVGSKQGIYVREQSGRHGGRWINHLAGRTVAACGAIPGGWWAAGDGFAALSTGQIFQAKESFTGGAFYAGSVFLAGGHGIWKLDREGLHLIQSHQEAGIHVVAVTQGCLIARLDEKTYRWEGSAFRPDPEWDGTSPYFVQDKGSTTYALTEDGMYAKNGPLISQVFTSFVDRSFIALNVGFHVENQAIIFANFNNGLCARSFSGAELWVLPVPKLGGTPSCLIRNPAGIMLGLNLGAIEVRPDLLMSADTEGRFGFGFSDKHLLLAGGEIDLATGEFDVGVFSAEADGIQGFISGVLIAGREVRLDGRFPVDIAPYGNGWAVLQEQALVLINKQGAVLSRHLLVEAARMIVDGETAWITTSGGLLRFDGKSVAEVKGAFARGTCAQGESGVVLWSGNKLSTQGPNGAAQTLPGKILAVSGPYAAIATEDGEFIGSYSHGAWEPLDIPKLSSPIVGLALRGDVLCIATSRNLYRLSLAQAQRLTLSDKPPLRFETKTDDFRYVLNNDHEAPWPESTFRVQAKGREIPLTAEGIQMPRLPYGSTELLVTEHLAGLTATQSITVTRLRPWWVNWPGYMLYFAGLSAGVWGIIAWRTRALRQKTEQLTSLVAERTRELRDAMKSQEFFFSSVSHEIRNPLNGVVGLCNLLAESSTVGNRDKFLVDALSDCSEQLNRVLGDVIDISLLVRGHIVLADEPFEVNAAISAAARTIDPLLVKTAVQTNVPPVWVRGDGGKLRQVVANLVSNAHKYGEPSRADLTVQTFPEGAQVRVRVLVRNTGNPIPEKEREAIFEPFMRGSTARTSINEGAGLGLAYSRRLMQAMGGSLALNLEEACTVFQAELCLPVSAPIHENRPAETPRKGRVLAIDDESYNRLVLGNLVEQLGYAVDWATDGAGALAAATPGCGYDLILTDYRLTDCDGISLARQIMAQLGERCPPIILVTAYSTWEKRQEASDAGIRAFVTKPVTRSKIAAALQGLDPSSSAVEDQADYDFSSLVRAAGDRAVLVRFAKELGEERETMLRSSDTSEIARLIHRINGKAALVRAEKLCRRLTELEGILAQGAVADSQVLVGEAARLIEDLRQAALHASEGTELPDDDQRNR